MPNPNVMRRVVLSGGSIQPSAIPGLVVWLKSDLGVWQDSAFSVPATITNDPVGGWQDQSGRGNHAIQATSTKRGSLIPSAQNHLPVIRFDGVTQFLKTAAFAWNQPCYVIAAWKLRTASAQKRYLEGNIVAGWVVYQNPNAGDLQLYAAAGGPVLTEGTAAFVIAEMATNRAMSYVALNGVASAQADPSTNSPGGLTLASRADGAAPSALDIGELAGFRGIPSDAQIQGLRGYFRSRWGV